jgi:hypothetical protein
MSDAKEGLKKEEKINKMEYITIKKYIGTPFFPIQDFWGDVASE